jgi:hypothetical protein
VPSAHLFDNLLSSTFKRVRSERYVNVAASNTIFNSSDLGFDFATVVETGEDLQLAERLV